MVFNVINNIYSKIPRHQNAEHIFSHNIQDCLPCGSTNFTASAVLHGVCSSSLQLHALCLAAAANSTLAGFTFNLNLAFLFRSSHKKNSNEKLQSLTDEETEEKEADSEKFILCRQCLQIITSKNERIEVEGSHYHTFANPHGIIYDIKCFRSAIGCGYVGDVSNEFAWFKGFGWRIAVCRVCLTHIGWLFSSKSSESFYGLILNRIIDSQ